jgi:hypothetical protein
VYGYDATNDKTLAVRTDAAGRLVLGGASSLSTDSTQTANPGTNWTALTAGACSQITIQNLTGTVISYRLGTSSAEFDLPNGSSVILPVLANSNEWQIRRKDTSNSQVTVQFLRVG